MNSTPINSPRELLQALTNVFPQYTFEQDDNDPSTRLNYHSLLRDFSYYFVSNNARFTERQHRAFATLVNKGVEAGGDLENAFATCLLEHLIQMRAKKPLSSFLSPEAKARLHA